jgi:hypothetical protein
LRYLQTVILARNVVLDDGEPQRPIRVIWQGLQPYPDWKVGPVFANWRTRTRLHLWNNAQVNMIRAANHAMRQQVQSMQHALHQPCAPSAKQPLSIPLHISNTADSIVKRYSLTFASRWCSAISLSHTSGKGLRVARGAQVSIAVMGSFWTYAPIIEDYTFDGSHVAGLAAEGLVQDAIGKIGLCR